MTERIGADLVVAEGVVRTYVQTTQYFIAAGLIVGDFEGVVGQVYFEPSVTNYGEMHLDDGGLGTGNLLYFSSGLSWIYGAVRNYGLISAVVPNSLSVRALFGPSSSPDIYNFGTILAGARHDAIGYQSSDPDASITNAATGIISAQAEERSLAVYLSNGGTVINHGQLLVHTTGGGHSMVPDTAVGVSFSIVVRSSLFNTGLIQATDNDPTTLRSEAVSILGEAPFQIVNSGTLRGDYAVRKIASPFVQYAYDLIVKNSGLMDGRVTLGSGNDLLENSGRIVGDVELGAGDDVYGGELGSVLGAISSGAGNDRLRGGSHFDHLLAWEGDDRISGGGGGDDLYGGAGLDAFIYAAASDSTDGGRDRIRAFELGVDTIELRSLAVTSISWIDANDGSGSYSLVSIVTDGGTLSIRVDGSVVQSDFVIVQDLDLFGTAVGDVLLGGLGDDRLDGGAGADAHFGGVGDDIYIFDHPGDYATERRGDGRDIIYTSVSLALTSDSEIEILSAADNASLAAMTLYGNDLANQLWGTDGANQLTGLAGNDALFGFGGVDGMGGGEDHDYLDGGSGNDGLFGEAGDDTLIGGSGSDYLDGGIGRDGMYGGPGDDFFLFDNGGDFAIEAAGEGRG